MKETPKYILIANRIRQEIAEGKYNAGDQLPQEMAIAKNLNVSRITVRNALKLLEDDGLIYRIQGAGTFVKDAEAVHKSNMDLDNFEVIDFDRESVRVEDFQVAKPTADLKDNLKLTQFDLCYIIKRAILYHDQEVGVQEMVLPVKVVQGLGLNDVKQSIYPYLEGDQDLDIASAERTYTIVDASEDLIKELSCTAGEKLLMVEQKSYLSNQQLFEYTRTFFKTSGYSVKRILRYK